MPTLNEVDEEENDDDYELFTALVQQLRQVALDAEGTCPNELNEMDDEVSDMTDKFKTSGRKDRSNSIRRLLSTSFHVNASLFLAFNCDYKSMTLVSK